jgi:hypothetical protein
MYDTINTRSPLAKKAEKVGVIFDIIGWIILIIGGTATALSLAALATDAGGAALLLAGGTAVYTAVMWASVSLATIVAQYVASKS